MNKNGLRAVALFWGVILTMCAIVLALVFLIHSPAVLFTGLVIFSFAFMSVSIYNDCSE